LEFEHVCAQAAITFTENTGAIMDCQTIEKYESIPHSCSAGWRLRLSKALHYLRPGYPNLDLGAMSDYLKRDMGFMDGRDPRQDSDMTR